MILYRIANKRDISQRHDVLPSHFEEEFLIKRVSQARVVRVLDTVGGGGVAGDSGARDRRWYPAHEAIRSKLVFTLISVHEDMFPGILHTKIIPQIPTSRLSIHTRCGLINMTSMNVIILSVKRMVCHPIQDERITWNNADLFMIEFWCNENKKSPS